MRYISLVALMLLAGSAAAQDAPLSDVTSQMLIERLSPKRIKTRGVRGLTVEPRADEPRVDLAIGFEYNSAELTDDAIRMLSIVADALKSDQLARQMFSLVGHTDARGGAEYNQSLSEARAQSAIAYLTRAHRIEEWRLKAQGLGETQLLFPDNPDDGRNRRVEIKVLN